MANYNAIRYNVPYSEAGSLKLIKTITASSDATISFVDGASDVVLDNTYKEYMFIFNNIHPETNSQYFGFKGSINTGSAYGVATTSTVTRAYHDEANSATDLEYEGSADLAQGTGQIPLSTSVGNGNDESCSGFLHLFDPSNTTFVKQFFTRTSGSWYLDYSFDIHVSGYVNTTSAINAVRFNMSSGNIDSGVIKMYGLSKS